MTKKNEKLDEKFEASLDAPGELPDPVDTGSTKRPADKDQKDPPKALTKAQMISGITHKSYKLSHPELTAKYREFFALADGGAVSAEANKATIKAGGLKEDIDTIFEGADLSEEFKDKATTIFEAAVNTAIIAETARLEEEFEARLEEELTEQVGTLAEALEKYLDHVATKWLEENKLQVESGLRADIAESFLAGLKGLFVEHHVEVPEEAVNVVEALTAQVEDLTARLNESEQAVIDAKAKLEEQEQTDKAAAALEEACAGLTDTQKEKLERLAEDLDKSADDFGTKLKQIAETLVAKKDVVPAADQLNEEVSIDESKNTVVVDPLVAAAVAASKKKF